MPRLQIGQEIFELGVVERVSSLDAIAQLIEWDRASFMRFCGFSRHEPTPERTAFVRFRREIVARGLDVVLFETVTYQLRAKAVAVKTGTLIDATVIGSASGTDADAGWSGHRARKAIHGDKAHSLPRARSGVAADADTGAGRSRRRDARQRA